MTSCYNLEHLKNTYESLLDFICSSDHNLQISKDVTNIWKTTNQSFLTLIKSFFNKKSQNIQELFPNNKFYSYLISHFERFDDKEMIKWVKSFNGIFLAKVSDSLKNTDLNSILSDIDFLEENHIELLDKQFEQKTPEIVSQSKTISVKSTPITSDYINSLDCLDENEKYFFNKFLSMNKDNKILSNKIERLESIINDLQKQLSDCQIMKASHFATNMEQIFDEEHDRFRKRLKTKISSISVHNSSCV